ncbi:MAG: alpha/beta hydrolase family protein [Alphaproteobacteria bacterium]
MLTRFKLLAAALPALCLAAGIAGANSELAGDLPRKDGKALEQLPGLETRYDSVTAEDGTRLRTITTRPEGAEGRLPGLYFVQWLSCSTIELKPGAEDGWSGMQRGVLTGSGMVVRRTEKAGVGDSEGECATLDYETELAHHRRAFAEFLESPQVDPERVFIYGASMGGNMAPLLAQGHDVAGVIIWGGGAKTWFERMLGFDRRALERGDTKPGEMHETMKRRAAFHTEYLVRGRDPADIARTHPDLEGVWDNIIGTGEGSHYGRPIAFHHQAQAQNWPAAWEKIRAPVLVLYGEYDWFEDEEAHALVANIVNRNAPGTARLVVFDGMNHHFSVFPDARAAFREEGGKPKPEPVVREILEFLEAHK